MNESKRGEWINLFFAGALVVYIFSVLLYQFPLSWENALSLLIVSPLAVCIIAIELIMMKDKTRLILLCSAIMLLLVFSVLVFHFPTGMDYGAALYLSSIFAMCIVVVESVQITLSYLITHGILTNSQQVTSKIS